MKLLYDRHPWAGSEWETEEAKADPISEARVVYVAPDSGEWELQLREVGGHIYVVVNGTLDFDGSAVIGVFPHASNSFHFVKEIGRECGE